MKITGPHYVRRNDSSRLPRRFVYLDTESRSAFDRRTQTQTFRLGVACWVDWSSRDRAPKVPEWGGFNDTRRMWEWITKRTSTSYRTVLVAHNLAYDLRVARAFVDLPALGWTCERVRLDHGSAFARWRRGRAALVMVDLYSWVPAPLEVIARNLRLPKPTLPPDHASDAEFVWRCVADVDAVRAAWSHIMGWLETEDMGTWQPTGAGQSWTAWRHRFMSHKVLVGLDDDTRTAERDSAWSGRCEAWRFGSLVGGPYAEWDYSLAYARIGADTQVPVRPCGLPRPASVDRVLRLSRSMAWLCRIHVQTDVPVAPAHRDGRIVWPVGTYRTTVWEHELRELVEAGAEVRIEWARPYLRRPALAEFMRWAIGVVEDQAPDADELIRAVVKQWTRALVGRFGMRYRRWESAGSADRPSCQLLPGVDLTTGAAYRLLWVGTDLLTETELLDFEEGSPAIMAYVMGEARCRLWRAMRTAGLAELLYVDTDSVIVTPRGSARIAKAVQAGRLRGLRRKAEYTRLEILSPRQIIAQGELRIAGVPKRADRVGERSFRYQSWRGLGEAIRRGEVDRVVVTERTARLRGADYRRVQLAGGRTRPVELTEGDPGADAPAPPAGASATGAGAPR